jgi:SAM domain (Sterile alpha motif)
MSEVRTWLVGIGLGQYADAFEANDIEMDLLKEVGGLSLRTSRRMTSEDRQRTRPLRRKGNRCAHPQRCPRLFIHCAPVIELPDLLTSP